MKSISKNGKLRHERNIRIFEFQVQAVANGLRYAYFIDSISASLSNALIIKTISSWRNLKDLFLLVHIGEEMIIANKNTLIFRLKELKSQLENIDTESYCFDFHVCLLYTSPSPRDGLLSRMPSSA